jgi:dTDP-4-amino-4,6-dideoxygalactose transaminase
MVESRPAKRRKKINDKASLDDKRPIRNNFLVFGSPLIEDPEINEVIDTLKSGWLGTGPKVHQFEEMFRKYKGSNFAMALNSCTAALHLSMMAIGIKPGDEVIVPTMTFAATANAVIHAGGKPVFADSEKDTMNIDPLDIERKITSKTRAMVPVHFAGRACNMDAIMNIAERYHIKVIEDCAHAIETEYHGKKAGTFGDIGCFSFYVTKNIVTGEGGMAITDNEEYANRIKILGLHGMSKDAWKRFSDSGYKHYQVMYAGFKYNMMDIQAAIGIHQLPRIDNYWHFRQKIWNRYNEAFENLDVFTPAPIETNTRHAYHLYSLLLDVDRLKISRDEFLDEMTKRNIGVGVHYIALHLHPYYQQSFGYKRGDFPNAEWISDRTVSLPLSAKLSVKDVGDVIDTTVEILETKNFYVNK